MKIFLDLEIDGLFLNNWSGYINDICIIKYKKIRLIIKDILNIAQNAQLFVA